MPSGYTHPTATYCDLLSTLVQPTSRSAITPPDRAGCIPLWKKLGRGRAPVPTLFGPKPGQPRGVCPYPFGSVAKLGYSHRASLNHINRTLCLKARDYRFKVKTSRSPSKPWGRLTMNNINNSPITKTRRALSRLSPQSCWASCAKIRRVMLS